MDAPEGITRRPSLRLSQRPQTAPMGPRTRTVTHTHTRPGSAGGGRGRESTLFTGQGAAPVYTPAPTNPSEQDTKPLAPSMSPIIEHYSPPPPPPRSPDRPPPPSTSSSPSNDALNVKAVPRVAALTPPPQLKFESPTVPWKGLPLDAALWTLDSKELQEIVSRAIRRSSRESFIRVLSVDNLDNVLPAELERLSALKAVTTSKYKFTVHRRTMLLQALQSYSNYNDKEGISKLTSQLSQTTSECDQLLEELLQIADQVGQINRLQDTHWASALAIALRKLNSSYGRRTADLLKAREKINALQAELSDAWKQAEELAREMDELDGVSDDDEAVIEVAEVISLNHRKSPSGSSSLQRSLAEAVSLDALVQTAQSQTGSPISPSTPAHPILDPPVAPSPTQTKLPSPSSSELRFVEETGQEYEFALPETPPSGVIPDTASLRSVRSVKSTRSTRTTRSQRTVDTSRVSVVSAARMRSQRTSISSLRMPTHRRKGSHPPVPSLPSPSSENNSLVTPDRRSSRVESFLDFGSRETTTDEDTEDTDGAESSIRPPTSINEIQVVARSPAPIIETRDDIHVMPSRSATERDLVATRRSQFSLDRQHPFAIEESVNHSIPSIWLMQETPRTTTERVDSMMMMHTMHHDPGQHHKKGSLSKLKSLTKRYSLPFGPAVVQARTKPRHVTGA